MFVSFQCSTWEPLQTHENPLANRLCGSSLTGLFPVEQSRCLRPHPTSLELCTYHDEKLTGLMFPFQGQPLPKAACLGPRRAGARTVSLHLEPPTHSPPKSREHAGASWHPQKSIPQPYSLPALWNQGYSLNSSHGETEARGERTSSAMALVGPALLFCMDSCPYHIDATLWKKFRKACVVTLTSCWLVISSPQDSERTDRGALPVSWL